MDPSATAPRKKKARRAPRKHRRRENAEAGYSDGDEGDGVGRGQQQQHTQGKRAREQPPPAPILTHRFANKSSGGVPSSPSAFYESRDNMAVPSPSEFMHNHEGGELSADDDDARDQSDFLQAYDELMYKDMSHDELVARIKLQDDEILRLRATVRELKTQLESK